MKLNVFAFTLAANAVGALGANAQTMIEERAIPLSSSNRIARIGHGGKT
jgi:hypothetical protein